MIPDFDSDGNLPPGIHWATWKEFDDHFGTTAHRRRLLGGLRLALNVLQSVGCTTVYIDGSFVTSKQAPNDFDACWDTEGVDIDLLFKVEPFLLIFPEGRIIQKAKYFGEFFPTDSIEGGSGRTFLNFFQIDKETGYQKGIIGLDLRRF